MSKTASVYIRLSTKKQEKGMSKTAQLNACRQYCKEHEYKIVKIYYENRSAMKPYNRPLFAEMLEKQRSKIDRVDVIVTLTVNRLTRNHVDFYLVKQAVDEYNTHVVFVRDSLVVQKPFKAHEEFLTDIMISNAKFEVNHMTEIRKRGLLERALTGIRPSKLNYGYGKYRNKVVVIPKEAEFVKQAFTLYATGKYSINSLSDELFELGYEYNNQRSKKIPRATLASMLKSVIYTGKFTYPGHEGLIQGTYKPIIDEELFNQVQKILNKPSAEIKDKHEYLYAKLITFKDTGALMSGEAKKGGKYIYYTARNPFNKNQCRCVNEEIITENILSRLELIKLNKIPKDIVNEVFKEHLKPITQALANARGAVSRQYHEELALKKYVDENGIDDKEFIESGNADIQEKYKNVSVNIQMLEDKISAQKSKYQDVLKMNLAEVFKLLDFKSKHQVLELIKSKFEIDSEKRIKITFNSAFRKLIER